MKKSKFILFALSFGMLVLVSWSRPEKAEVENVSNYVAVQASSSMVSDSECYAELNCYPASELELIIAKIEFCYGWPNQGPPSCYCLDLNHDGRVNVLDLIHLSSNLC